MAVHPVVRTAASLVLILVSCGGGTTSPASGTTTPSRGAGLPEASGASDAGASGESDAAAPGALEAGSDGTTTGTETYFLSTIYSPGSAGPVTVQAQCLPQPQPVDSLGDVPCEVFEVLAANTPCSSSLGLAPVDPGVAASVLVTFGARRGTVCALAELPGAECATSTAPGWCYSPQDSWCSQAIVFSFVGLPAVGTPMLVGCL